MTDKHPLNFFYDLITYHRIKSMKQGFFHVWHKEHGHFVEGYAVEANEEEGHATFLSQDGTKSKVYFIPDFTEKITKEKNLAVKNLDITLFSTSDQTVAERVKLYLIIIKELLYLLTQYEEAKEFPVIEESLEEIQNTVSRKFGIQPEVIPEIKIDKRIKSTGKAKLKWNGQTNILTTLFYELNTVSFNKANPFLDVSQTELVDFIIESFTDKDGNDFERTTIQTNLNAGKPEKRAKEHKRVPILKIVDNEHGKTSG